MVYAWVFNGSGQKLIVAILLHAMNNTAAPLLPFLHTEQGKPETAYWAFVAVNVVFAVIFGYLIGQRKSPGHSLSQLAKKMNLPGRKFVSPSFLSLLVAVLFTNLLLAQLLHEAGHWAVLSLTGRDPVWGLTGLVQLWDREPLSPSQWVEMVSPDGETGWLRLSSLPGGNADWVAFIVAGPLAQVLAIAVGLAIATRSRRPAARTFGLMVALVNSFGHFFYQVVSSLRGGGGDETLLGYYLNIPWPLVSLVFGAASAAGLLAGFALLPSARIRLKWGATLFLGTLPVGPLLMRANGLVIDGVDANNPWFRPVLGFSFPVLLLGLISAIAIFLVVRGWEPKVIEAEPPAG